MSNLKPKPDDRLGVSLRRLDGNPDFRAFRDHIQKLADYHRELLVTTPMADVQIQQGIVRGLREILDLATKE